MLRAAIFLSNIIASYSIKIIVPKNKTISEQIESSMNKVKSLTSYVEKVPLKQSIAPVPLRLYSDGAFDDTKIKVSNSGQSLTILMLTLGFIIIALLVYYIDTSKRKK